MRPDEALAQLVAQQHGAFTTSQALAIGFTRRQIEHRRDTGRWSSRYRGVHVLAGTSRTRQQEIIAATLAYSAVASHRTAAELFGLVQGEGPIEVTLPYGKHRKPRPGIVVHQAGLSRRDVRRIDNIPVTCPNRTLVDFPDEAALDEAIRRGLTTVAALGRYMETRGGLRDPTLRVLLNDREHGSTQSALERLFLRKLRSTDLPEPARQYPVGRYRVDFAWPQLKVAVELDGLGSHFSAAAFRADLRRQNDLVLAGWTLLRFSWEDVAQRWPETEAALREAFGSVGRGASGALTH